MKKIVLVFFLFSAITYGMEIDIIAKRDPYSIVDLLHDNGSYLKELIVAGSGVNYCHDFAIAQKTVRFFLDDKKRKIQDVSLGVYPFECKYEEVLVSRFGKEAISLAQSIVEQQKIRKALFSVLFDKTCCVTISNDHNKKLKKLIKKCPVALNARGYSHKSYGGTLTHYVAARCNDFSPREKGCDILKFLLKCGANPHMLDKYKRTPLFYAIKKGSREAVECLLQRKACVNIKDCEGNTPLHCAVVSERKRRSITLELLRHAADPNVTNKWGDTPLHVVLGRCVGSKVTECLLCLPNLDLFKRNGVGKSFIEVAIDARHSYDLTLLLFKVFSVCDASYDFHNGKESRCNDIERLIYAGADVDARNNHNTCINYVYNKLDDLEDCTVLSYVLHHKCEKCLRLLIEHNVDIKNRPNHSFNNWSYIDVAVHYGFYDAVGILVNAGLPIWYGQEGSHRLLLSAAANKNNEAVKVLLYFGVLVNESIVAHSDDGDNDDIVALLSKAYQEEGCCICFESQELLENSGFSLEYIACKNNHRRNFICKKCHDGLKVMDGKKLCPFNCQHSSGDFNTYK